MFLFVHVWDEKKKPSDILFSTFLRAMILAMCLAACLIEQPSINLLNIYINNNNGNNNDDVVVQNMQFATLSYMMCYFVKANIASFFFFFSLLRKRYDKS